MLTHKRIFQLLAILLLILLIPTPAYAHSGGTMAAIAPALAWIFLGFGAVVIGIVSAVLFGRGAY